MGVGNSTGSVGNYGFAACGVDVCVSVCARMCVHACMCLLGEQLRNAMVADENEVGRDKSYVA